MDQTTKAKVPFIVDNVGICSCPKCPVQGASSCVKGKVSTIQAALKKNPLKREDIPGLYCSTGTATCQDLNPNKACICGGCPVFGKYNLSSGTPVGYYCRDGSSK